MSIFIPTERVASGLQFAMAAATFTPPQDTTVAGSRAGSRPGLLRASA